MANEKELTHIDLFSGIGGFTLAGEWAGFRTVVFCEKDDFCQKVLQKHWPEVPIIKEIRGFDGKKWRGATLLTGGFPCQPFSVAGQRRGKEDDRYLWPQMRRVISEAKPRWILAENVFGIFRMALDTVLADLEGEGYATGTFIIPACSLNAPHRRNRVWIVANSRCQYGEGVENERESGRPLFKKENAPMPERPIKNDESGDAQDSQGKRLEGRTDRQEGIEKEAMRLFPPRPIINASDSGNQGLQGGKCSKTFQERQEKPHGSIIECDRSSAWQEDWLEVATRFCRVDDGVSDRVHRLKALGNAIVPQVAYEILKNIVWIENEEIRCVVIGQEGSS